jgi:regulator of sigma E protease
MEYPTTILGWMSVVGVGGLGFVFTITLVVFVHELGHFLAARYFGVRVESFSIGFGRALFGFKDRYGTHWKVGWLPLGGYVKFWGDEGVSSTPDHDKIEHATAAERAGSFHHKALWKKAIIAVGGPVANFILALVILTTMYLVFGERLASPQIGYVGPGSPAERAGLQVGDIVEQIDGHPVREFGDIMQIVTVRQDRALPIIVKRDGARVALSVTPKPIEKIDVLGNKIMDAGIGVGNVQPGRVKSVSAGSPAAVAGLLADDVVFGVNGKGIESLADVSAAAVAAKPGESITLNVARKLAAPTKSKDSEALGLKVVPRSLGSQAGSPDEIVASALGFEAAVKGSPKSFIDVRFGPVEAVARAASQVRFIVVKTLDFIGRLLTGSGDYQQLSGPIGIAQVSGQVLVFFGVVALINLAAVLSVSIGLLNLFPIPMLDGGHLLYYGIEAVRGRPLGERAQELGFRIGFAFVVGLMLFATWNDISKFKLF